MTRRAYTTITSLPLLLLLAALWLLGACAEQDPESATDGDSTEDGDWLPDGDDPTGSGVIGLELTPPADRGLLPQQIAGLDLETFDGSIVLRRSVTYSGEVRQPSDAPAESLITLASGSQVATIPGRPLPNLTATSSEALSNSDKSEFNFLALVGLYTLYAFPKASLEHLYPPIVRHDGLLIEQDRSEVLVYERGLDLRGEVVSAGGEPLPLVKVSAFSAEPWRRSSISTTGSSPDVEPDSGEFILRVSAQSATYDLVVQGSSLDPFKPKLTLPNMFVVEDGTVRVLGPTDEDGRLIVTYGAFSGALCRMEGRVLGHDNAPVAGARLTFSNAIGGGQFTATATSDENGLFGLDLLRTQEGETARDDDYKISLVPPVEGADSAWTLSAVDCHSERVVLDDILLSRRLALTGQVRDARGATLADVTVQAWKIPESADSSVYIKTALTDGDGHYELLIDPGKYTLSFIPPSGSGLARSILRDIQTSTSAVIDQRLTTGQVFSGRVVDADGNAVPWTFIEVFRERPASGTSEAIGSGSCDDAGVFRIVIP